VFFSKNYENLTFPVKSRVSRYLQALTGAETFFGAGVGAETINFSSASLNVTDPKFESIATFLCE
jgi:hypothetical protein